MNRWKDGCWKDGSMDVGSGWMDKRKEWLDGLMGGFGDIMYECYWSSVITLKKKFTINKRYLLS
jgi:hypothetical protein